MLDYYNLRGSGIARQKERRCEKQRIKKKTREKCLSKRLNESCLLHVQIIVSRRENLYLCKRRFESIRYPFHKHDLSCWWLLLMMVHSAYSLIDTINVKISWD